MAPKPGTLRPHKWKSGPDPMVHRKYLPFLQARAQAKYRREKFFLSFEDFCFFWTDANWELRGRKTMDLALTRIDYHGPWSKENCHVVTRKQQLGEANIKKHSSDIDKIKKERTKCRIK